MLCPLVLAGEADNLIPDDVREAVIGRVANRYNPSIVVGVRSADAGEILCEGHTRWIDGDPVTPDTVYEIGSITKTFTGLLLADMAHRGEVNLNDPIDKFLPQGFAAPRRYGRSITLVHLAEHSSGLPRLPDNMPYEDPADPYASYTSELMFEFLDGYSLDRDIGSKYDYSNLGMGLLGELLSRRAGMSYEELVVQRITDPLNMPSTRMTINDSMKRRLALGHDGAENAKRWKIAALAGAGDLDSTVKDMLNYVWAHLDTAHGPLTAAMKLATTPRRRAGSADMKIGLGWHIRIASGHSIVWHNGGTGGFRAFCGFSKARRIAVVALTNNAQASVDDIGFHLLDPRIPLDAQWNRETVRLSPEQLARLEGRYELRPNTHLDIRQENGFLTVQPQGQPVFTLHAASESEFFLIQPEAGATFELDADQQAVALTWSQGGVRQRGRRMGDVPERRLRERKKIDPKILARYVGRYQLLPEVFFDVTARGDQLYVKLTGQPSLPVYAESQTRFFYEVVEAAITFEVNDDGMATALVLHQGGMDQRATKIK